MFTYMGHSSEKERRITVKKLELAENLQADSILQYMMIAKYEPKIFKIAAYMAFTFFLRGFFGKKFLSLFLFIFTQNVEFDTKKYPKMYFRCKIFRRNRIPPAELA